MQCPACGHLVIPVQVTGHLQCPHCNSVIEGCCEGETQEVTAESDPDTLGALGLPPEPLRHL
jgi:phage FluMu protein Com